MSYKDGIPLLHPFEDGDDDDDDDVLVETSTRRGRCRKKHICFGVVLGLAVLIIIGIAAGVTVPLVFLQHSGGTTGGVQGVNQTESTSRMTVELTSMPMATSPTTGPTQSQLTPTSHTQTRSSTQSQGVIVPTTSAAVPTQPSPSVTMATQPSSSITMATQLSSSVTMATQPSSSVTMAAQTSSLVTMATQPSSSVTMATQPRSSVTKATQTSSVPAVAQSSLPAQPTLPSSVITQHSSSPPAMALTSLPSLSPSMATPAGSSARVMAQSRSSVPMTNQFSMTFHPSSSVAMANHSASSLAMSHMTTSVMSPLHSPTPSSSSPLPTQMPSTQLMTAQLRGTPSLSATVPETTLHYSSVASSYSPVLVMASLTPTSASVTSLEQIPPTAMLSPSPSQQLVYIKSVSSHVLSPTPTPTVTPLPQPNTEVEKSARDNRTYQVLCLENDLRVLLISDPDSNISAAAMEVAVGSFSDPPEVQGLAHFCEHMLFLGTQKYPNEHVYSNFLSTHGGYDNAFTFMQETHYFFSVEADYLEHALDMFAQFFIAPLFTPGAVSNESHAVNAEHEKNLQSDEWRLWQLLKYVSNPAHPFSQFATGNLQTLSKSNILDYLHRYYSTHYSANQVSPS